MDNENTTLTAVVRQVHRGAAGTARSYWRLIKSLQTSLLLITGVGGYMSAYRPEAGTLLGLCGSLFLSISGSTVLNMVLDRDIDASMERTAGRPLPAGRVSPREALLVGLSLSWLGLAWAVSLSLLYGVIVAAGLVLDVGVYTRWLKRRTAWSVIWGGVSGGIPVLAGRALGLGRVDLIGVLLALGVLTWIPSHIMPLTIKYLEDYRRAGVPTFPSVYGVRATRVSISVAVTVTAVVMLVSAGLSGVSTGGLLALGLLGLTLFVLAVLNAARWSPRLNLGLFKFASLYMLGAMVLMIVG
jgi:protoheme IX farnesyltransferase